MALSDSEGGVGSHCVWGVVAVGSGACPWPPTCSIRAELLLWFPPSFPWACHCPLPPVLSLDLTSPKQPHLTLPHSRGLPAHHLSPPLDCKLLEGRACLCFCIYRVWLLMANNKCLLCDAWTALSLPSCDCPE